MLRRPAAALAAALLLLAALSLVAPRARGADDLETVDAFLARLGLVDLQILHLEKALAEERPGQDRLKLARRLADLYAARLMTAADDAAAYDDLLKRIDGLIKNHPQANTTSLAVMLLQADYNRAEAQVARWVHAPAETAARDAGRGILARITPELNRLQQELDAAVQKLSKDMELPESEEVRKAKEGQYERLAAVAGRAGYFAAWANYYTGLVNPASGRGGDDFQRARDGFRKLLGIEGNDYSKLEADSLGLDSTWRARAMIGLGLAEAASGDLAQSARCFKLLEHSSVPLEIRDQAGYWYVQALLSAGKHEEAQRLAQERIAAFSGGATPGTVSLCAALVRAGFAPDGPQRPANAEALGMLGLAGLARLQQFGTIYKLLDKHKIDLSGASGFLPKWILGQKLFAAAEKSKSAEDYRAAAESLSAALAAPDARAEVASAGRCRYTLGWCYYRLGEHEKAARQFEDAVTGLKASGAGDAVEAAWMAFASYQRLAAGSPRFVTRAIEVLESINRDFPNHPYAKKADVQIARLQQNAVLPDEAIRTLSKIKPDDPQYAPAQYDLCLLHYRKWSAARAQGKDAGADAAALRSAVDAYLGAAKADEEPSRKVRCLLLAVAAAMDAAPPDAPLAAQYLAKAAPLADALPPSSSEAADYHYRALKQAQQSGDSPGAAAHAGWLVRNAQGSVYEQLALIVAAKAADEAVKASSGEGLKKARQQALEVYARLAKALGDSPEIIASKKNALVTQCRLAQYAADLGRHQDAAEALEKVLAAYPKDRGALRQAGLAYFEARDYDQSVRHWRTLLAGLEDASDEWYEAKFYQIACLAQTDRQSARDVFEQFKLLHPGLGPEAWRPKFTALGRQLGAGPGP